MPVTLSKLGCTAIDAETGLIVGGIQPDLQLVDTAYIYHSKTGQFSQINSIDTLITQIHCGRVLGADGMQTICTSGKNDQLMRNTYAFEPSTARLERKAEWDLPGDSQGGRLLAGSNGRMFFVMRNDKVLEFTVEKVNGLHWNMMDWEVQSGYLVVVQVDYYQN